MLSDSLRMIKRPKHVRVLTNCVEKLNPNICAFVGFINMLLLKLFNE